MTPSAGPFASALAFVLLLVVVPLSFLRPALSVCLFVLASPLQSVAEQLGWDPRLFWALALGARAFAELLQSRRLRIPRGALLAGAGFFALATIGLWAAYSSLAAPDVLGASSILYHAIGAALVSLAVVQFSAGAERIRRLVLYLAAAGTFVALVGYVEAVTLVRSAAPDRIGSTLLNANSLATYLGLCMVAIIVMAARSAGGRRKGLLLCACLCAGGLLLTASRSGILATVAGLAVYWFPAIRRRFGARRVWIGMAVGACVLVAALIGLGILRNRITMGGDESALNLRQTVNDLTRLEALLYGVKVVQSNPVFGVGLGTFAARNFGESGFFVTTHNTVLQILTGTGFAGGLLIALMLYQLAVHLSGSARRILAPVVVTFAIASLFGDYLHSMEIVIVLASVYAYAQQQDSNEAEDPSAPALERTSPAGYPAPA